MRHYQIIISFLLISLTVLAGEYTVDKQKENLVKFISDAPIEDFEGTTDKIDGYIFWEGDDLLQASELYFEVDLNAIDTGIGLRNRHMRENYLHTDKYPFTHFTGKLLKHKKNDDGSLQVTAMGKMFIHGVEKEKEIEGRIAQVGEKAFRITCKFEVKLSDYNIEVPSIMFYKIDETMQLEVDFFVKATE